MLYLSDSCTFDYAILSMSYRRNILYIIDATPTVVKENIDIGNGRGYQAILKNQQKDKTRGPSSAVTN